MSELIANFNNLTDLFTKILEESRSLYDGNGLPPGQTILVHSALSAFGQVSGGERTVVRALDFVRRNNGLTIVMPAHQDDCRDDDLGKGFDEPFGGMIANGRFPVENPIPGLEGGGTEGNATGLLSCDATGQPRSDVVTGRSDGTNDDGAGSAGANARATGRAWDESRYSDGVTDAPEEARKSARRPGREKNGRSMSRRPADPRRIPCRGMGRIADEFRRTRGVRRSDHPTLSFCAKGPLAREILAGHRRAAGLGFASPLGELYRRDGLVLMLGTDWQTCTALHLAEYEAARRIEAAGGTVDRVTCRARSGKRGEWAVWEDIAYRTELFPGIGRAFEAAEKSRIRSGPMGAAGREWRLFRVRDIVEFSIDRYGVLR